MDFSLSPGKEYFLVDTDQLRQLIIDYSPEIRRDTNRMEDMISQIVSLEREKRGLDKLGGKGTLQLNPGARKNPKAPDFTGQILISAKRYEVKAYVGKNQEFINLTFSP